MAGIKFSDYLGLNHYKKAKKNKNFIHLALAYWPQSFSSYHKYRTRAIISRSQFEAALVYKPQILSLKNEEFPFLVHKLSAI